jgi:hypothetical protein
MKPPPLAAQLEDGHLREPRERLCDIDRRFVHVTGRAAFRCGSGERPRWASRIVAAAAETASTSGLRSDGNRHRQTQILRSGASRNWLLWIARARTACQSTIPCDQARFSLALRNPVDGFLSLAHEVPPPPPPPATTFPRRLHVIFTRAPLIYFPC